MSAITDIDPLWAGDGRSLPDWFVRALEVPREEGFVDVEGVAMHYLAWGDPAGKPLLMTHGFLSHARCFAFIAPFLAQDYRIVAYDLSGMGDSGVRTSCDLRGRGLEMIGVAEALGLSDGPDKPIVVAHSFGSAVALAALAEAPEAFAGTVICDLMVLRPAMLEAFWVGRHTSPGSGDPDRPHRRYPDYASARPRYVLSPPQQVGEPFLMEYMAYHALRRDGDGWVWKFSPEVFRRDNSRAEWLEIGPRLVGTPGRKVIIHGEQSLLFTGDSRDYLHELGGTDIPMIAVPEARHHLMLDQPLAFLAALRAVLAVWA